MSRRSGIRFADKDMREQIYDPSGKFVRIPIALHDVPELRQAQRPQRFAPRRRRTNRTAVARTRWIMQPCLRLYQWTIHPKRRINH